MLPFLKPKQGSGVIIQSHRSPDQSSDESKEVEEINPGLIACAHDMIVALHSKDSKALAMAIKAAFEICDSEPHVEGEHVNSYDELNAKAAKGQE